jgi:hypothetical protein
VCKNHRRCSRIDAGRAARALTYYYGGGLWKIR